MVYVPNAAPHGDGSQGLQPLGLAGQVVQLSLLPVTTSASPAAVMPTSVALFDQGPVQILQAAVTGLEPRHPYVLALSGQSEGSGPLEPLAAFTTNPAGAAVVNAVGPIRQIVRGESPVERRYLVIAPGTPAQLGVPVQVQSRER